jgi:hypothetical protein
MEHLAYILSILHNICEALLAEDSKAFKIPVHSYSLNFPPTPQSAPGASRL